MAGYFVSGSLLQHCVRLVLICCTAGLLSSCATRLNFAPSTVVPGAEGKVKIKRDGNNNYSVSINVQNLAEPNRLPQPQNVYVVWADTPQGPQNLGQLRTSSGLFGGKMKASLETVTPYRPSRIFVTAENTATVPAPGFYVVMNTRSF